MTQIMKSPIKRSITLKYSSNSELRQNLFSSVASSLSHYLGITELLDVV
jgi:hypothetical protein